MIHSVLRIQEPFQKLTNEFVEEEFALLRDIYNALEPVRHLTEVLCSDGANLLTADAAFVTTFNWLKNDEGQYAKDVYDALYKR